MEKVFRLLCCFALAFTFSAAARGACVTQPIDFGETRNGVLATDDCVDHNGNGKDYYYDYYEFTGTAGQQILITNVSTAIDADLLLVLPDNTTTVYNDDGAAGTTNARIPVNSGFYTLTQSGKFHIVTSSAISLQTGAYTLVLTSATPAACHVAAQPASSAGLPVAAGTPVTISAVCGSGTTPITYTWDNGAFTGAVRTVTPTATTTYNIVASNASGASPPFSLTVYVAQPPPGTPTIEFYNVDLAHYFVTAVPAEATAIDNGSAGPGWVRTGFSYDVYTNPVASLVKSADVATNPVCRFYGTPGIGPNSHFYTVDANECTQVKRDPGWKYEGIAFHIAPPQIGGCPAGTQPVYRVYNNRAQFNDSNHRFITNKTTFLQMGDLGWTLEGIVMCTGASRAPTAPVTGGTFKDPSGAGVIVAPGQIPKAANAVAPVMRPAPNLPPGMVEASQGETNVTAGAPGYTFNLTGDTGFTTTTPNAVSISLPFSASSIPAADQTPVKVVARIYNPKDAVHVDLTGSLAVNGTTGILTVETRGLPRSFTGSVLYVPSMDSAASDQAPAADIETGLTQSRFKVDKVTWPVQSWCIIYNPRSPTLIAAVKTLLNLAGNPTAAQIKNTLIDRVGLGARRAQTAFENDGHAAPNLIVATTCGGTTPRYNIHMETEGSGVFVPNDEGGAISSRGNPYGRLYIDNARLDDAAATDYGTVLASVAHEMHHASQDSQQLLTAANNGFVESAAAAYGKTIDNNGTIRVRPNEPQVLSTMLMVYEERQKYDSQHFLAYVGRQYNAGSLNYLTGLYKQMQAAVVADDSEVFEAGFVAMHTFFMSAFSQTLPAIYLDFVRQRALTHNANSVMGHPGEVTSGFAANLFPGTNVARHNIDVTACASARVSGGFALVDRFATKAIVISATGAVPTSSTGPTLNVKIVPEAGTVGGIWNGWTWRANAAAALAETNKFSGFGKQAGEQVVLLLSNLSPSADQSIAYEITCGGVKIDSISPVKGAVGTVVTINGSGFGAQNDPRSVTVNGLAMTGVTWVSDTVLRATVPANASSGDVIVTVNGEKSNGVPFEVVAQCSAQQTAGGDTPDIRTIELGKTAGTFNFSYETYAQEDRIIVRYPNATGAVLHDSTCVGTNGTRTVPLSYSGNQSTISVQVIPNCRTGTGTSWNYTVSCP